jgi:L-2-hydroxyglutarate oxidase
MEGDRELLVFCKRKVISRETCVKIVVATREEELPRIEDLHQCGVANGLAGPRILSSEEIEEIGLRCAGVRGFNLTAAITEKSPNFNWR